MNLYNICVLTAAASESAGYNWVKMIIIALVVGLLIGLIYAMCLKGQLTSVVKNDTAADYTRPGSFKVETKRDIFLYTKVEKEEKPKDNANK